MATVSISFSDVLARRAFIRLPPEAKVKLAHMAGAPWFDKDASATLHDHQIEALVRKEREKIIHGGSRWGKSVLGGVEGICEAMLPFSSLAVVASRYDHCAHEFQYIYKGLRTLFKKHSQVFKRLRYTHRATQHEYSYETVWGSQGKGFSVDSDDGSALLGQAFTRMIFGEGSHISYEILQKKALRALDGALMRNQDGETPEAETGYLTIYTTPKGYEGCSAAEWERVHKQTNDEPRKLWYSLVPFAKTVWLREAEVTENPYYSTDVYEARRASLSKAAFQEQYQGKMTFASGRVLAEFDDDRHIIQMPPPELIRKMTLGVGIDTGAYYGAVLSGLVMQDGRRVRYKLGNSYLEQKDIYTSIKATERMIVDVLGPVFKTDSFKDLSRVISVWSVDPASQHKPEIHGIWDGLDITLRTPSGLYGGKLELDASLDVVRNWILTDSWFVVKDCEDLIAQIRRYIWKTVRGAGQKNAPVVKEPRKTFDHLIDASRFIDFALEVEGTRDEPLPPMTINDMLEQARRDSVFGPLREAMRQGKEEEDYRNAYLQATVGD